MIMEEKKPTVVHARVVPDPEVPEKTIRRRFTAAYQLRILKEAENCTKPGQIGALLRREGLYSSNLARWRHEVTQGLVPQKRGPSDTQDRSPRPS
jgi:transposase